MQVAQPMKGLKPQPRPYNCTHFHHMGLSPLECAVLRVEQLLLACQQVARLHHLRVSLGVDRLCVSRGSMCLSTGDGRGRHVWEDMAGHEDNTNMMVQTGGVTGKAGAVD